MSSFFIVVLVAVSGAMLFLTSTGRIPSDSAPEELVEEVLEDAFDLDIDLSPGSPEDEPCKDKDL